MEYRDIGHSCQAPQSECLVRFPLSRNHQSRRFRRRRLHHGARVQHANGLHGEKQQGEEDR